MQSAISDANAAGFSRIPFHLLGVSAVPKGRVEVAERELAIARTFEDAYPRAHLPRSTEAQRLERRDYLRRLGLRA